MTVEKKMFGTTGGGKAVDVFFVTSAAGMRFEFISYGAAIKSVKTPDGTEITYGFDTLAEYEAHRFFFGATVGRFANRIARGAFSLNGKTYALACNNGANHLHGGKDGFDRRVWNAEHKAGTDSVDIVFSYNSPDGEEGYPGNLCARVIYTVTDGGELSIVYEGTADAATPFNPSNHTYWNLAGAKSGSILAHELELCCPFYLPVDSTLIPTGEILSVKNTPMDFLRAKPFGKDIDSAAPNGYDHCFVIAGDGQNALRRAAFVRDPQSGRGMEVLTTTPGVQVYSGNFIERVRIAGGAESCRRGAFCLETELFPDSVNQRHFPSPFIHPEIPFSSRTVFKFSR